MDTEETVARRPQAASVSVFSQMPVTRSDRTLGARLPAFVMLEAILSGLREPQLPNHVEIMVTRKLGWLCLPSGVNDAAVLWSEGLGTWSG